MICVKLLLAVSAVDKSHVILVWQEAQHELQDCPGGRGRGSRAFQGWVNGRCRKDLI